MQSTENPQKEITMDKDEFRVIIGDACNIVDKLENVGLKLNSSEKKIVKGILYSLYYGTIY